MPRFALSPRALDHARYQRFAEFLKTKGMIKTVPPLSSYAVDLGARTEGDASILAPAAAKCRACREPTAAGGNGPALTTARNPGSRALTARDRRHRR